ncbi:hypothetical protein M9H77_12720 [Catharanthus roseus]|uniref:Uncharacterized protein n=1 Tax=Catharanthus roseus TaxID=4058 RepID=A0ACC0BIE5_CATRO|nr:hypothetical protein M9H77_12720 [Catharanthus roseus]
MKQEEDLKTKHRGANIAIACIGGHRLDTNRWHSVNSSASTPCSIRSRLGSLSLHSVLLVCSDLMVFHWFFYYIFPFAYGVQTNLFKRSADDVDQKSEVSMELKL